MKKIIFLYCVFFLSTFNSCKDEKKELKETDLLVKDKKNESIHDIILNLNHNKTIDYLDLSNKNMDVLPDLSRYRIKKLNISFNNIDTLPLNKFPKELEKLNASNNKITNFEIFNASKSFGLNSKLNNKNINLAEIDLSNNKLKNFNIVIIDEQCILKKVNIANNDLAGIQIYCTSLQFLDISNNKNLSNELDMNIDIDTIIRKNIKNNLPLRRLLPKAREKKPVF